MRKPRDYDAELKALAERSRDLRARKLVQLGELVTNCGADTLPIQVLAGVLLEAVATKDASQVEGWRTSGAAFFQRTRGIPARVGSNASRRVERGRTAATPGSEPGAS